MLFSLSMPVIFSTLLVLLLLFFYLGLVANKYKKNSSSGGATLVVEGTLLSLLLSFTFGLAANKYDKRRSDLIHEVNNISTVMMVTQLYPDSIGKELLTHLKPYLKQRIDYFNVGSDQKRIDRCLASSDSIADIIFAKVSRYAKNQDYLAYTQQMVPALISMFDSVTEREVFRKTAVPASVLNLLMVVSLIVSFQNGYNQEKSKRNWVQAIGFALLIVFSFMLIVDFNDNRSGKINLHGVEKYMIELQEKYEAIPGSE